MAAAPSLESAVAVLKVLDELQLLPSSYLEQLKRTGAQTFPSGAALVHSLAQRGWLTDFQVACVLEGRAAELVLGSYRLLAPLGEGGMGQVFQARHQLMNRIVAVKVIRRDWLNEPSAIRRFRREIELAGQLSHPNIVVAHDAEQIGNRHFLVMEYCEGPDLGRLVHETGPLAVGYACLYMRQAAGGLQHAWQRGIIHRDIKPSNLLVTPEGVKILDMGLARLRRPPDTPAPASTLTERGAVLGTPDFMAPEQAQDLERADIRSDLYSLGCTFYFALSGQVPYPGGTAVEKILRHVTEEPERLERLRPDVPADVIGIVRRLMAREPSARYQTPGEVIAALEPFAQAIGPAPLAGTGAAGGPARTTVPDCSGPARLAGPTSRCREPSGTMGVSSTGAAPPLPAVPDCSGPARLAGPTGRCREPSGTKRDSSTGAAPPLPAVQTPVLERPATRETPNAPNQSTARPPTPVAGSTSGARRRWIPISIVAGSIVLLSLAGWAAMQLIRHHQDASSSSSAATGPKEVPRQWQTRSTVGEASEEVVLAVAFSPDSTLLAIAFGDPTDPPKKPGRVEVWRLDTNEKIATVGGLAGPARCVAFNRDGKTLAAAAGDWNREIPGLVVIWDLSANKERTRFEATPQGVHALAFDGTGDVLATGGHEGSLKLWNLSQDPPELSVDLTKSRRLGAVNTVSFSKDDTQLVSAEAAATVRWWNVGSGELLGARQVQRNTFVIAAAFLGEDQQIVAATGAPKDLNGPEIYLWDPQKTEPIRTIRLEGLDILSLAVAPDGKTFATGCQGGIIRFWRADEEKEVAVLQPGSGQIMALAFSPDGKLLATAGGWNRNVTLWEERQR